MKTFNFSGEVEWETLMDGVTGKLPQLILKCTSEELITYFGFPLLARMFHELLSRDLEDGRATGEPQGVGSEAYLNGTSQEPRAEATRKDGHIRGRSKRLMKYPDQVGRA